MVNNLDLTSDLPSAIVCDPQGIPWAFWCGEFGQSEYQDFYSRWNGAGWDEELLMYPLDTFLNYRTKVAFDSEGWAWAVWTREAGVQGHGDYEIFYTRMNGNDWESPTQLNPTNPRRLDDVRRIAIKGDEIWIVTYSYPPTRDSSVVLTSRWNGAGWDTLSKVSPDGEWAWFSDIAVDNSGRPHIVWCDGGTRGRIYYRMRNDNGWTTPIWINNPDSFHCVSWAAPRIAIDNLDNLHVVWVGVNIGAGETDWDIFYSKYDGERWLAPIQLNYNDDYREMYPDIALTSPDNIWVVWDKEFAFWEAHSYAAHFNGREWSKEERLDSDSSFYNCDNWIALDQTGNPWDIYWGITCSVNNSDIYSTRYVSSGISLKPFIPSQIYSVQVYPNPFRHTVTIEYQINTNAFTSLDIFDVNGKLIKKVVNGTIKPGQHVIIWDGTDKNLQKVSKGVYFCKISSDGHTETQKLVLIK